MSRLKDHLNSRYFEAANQMTSKKARRRIVAYVESYDDIYFWRTVLGRFEDDKRYFEVMLPSHQKLERGKKSVLMSFIEGRIGEDMIACVDADYDYLLQGVTPQSKKVVESPYVFHTYAYAIENLQCYAPSLHDVCVAVTLNDHRLFDFEDYLTQYSEAIFPLFIWSVWAYHTGRHNQFSLSDMARVIDPGGFNVFSHAGAVLSPVVLFLQKERELRAAEVDRLGCGTPIGVRGLPQDHHRHGAFMLEFVRHVKSISIMRAICLYLRFREILARSGIFAMPRNETKAGTPLQKV